MLGATAAHRISNGLKDKRKKGDVISGGEGRGAGDEGQVNVKS